MKNKKSKISRAFTIVELLIVVFIFSSVMIMASSSFATSYISGRTHSSSSMEANRSLTTVLDIIGQQMANANNAPTISGTKIYGFKVVGSTNNILAISSQPSNTATYFGLSGTAIRMYQDTIGTIPTDAQMAGYEQISSPDIKITQFDLTQRNECTASPCTTAPYITIKITGTDTKTGGAATLQSTYSIPAYTYNKW